MRSLLLAAVVALAAAAPAAGGPPRPAACSQPGCGCTTCDAHCRCCPVGPPDVVGDFRPGGPVGPAGTRAVCDPPAAQHMRNTGGNDLAPDRWGRPTNPGRVPGRGSGLCVFTSVEVAGRWQHLAALDGFQKWMTNHEGGGWPEKLDQMLKQFCAQKGAPVPGYVQHTGGDEAFLELALATGRMPAVTYGGEDDFYQGPIGHMVNLAHLDAWSAAIIDNNRPGAWVWMTRGEFLQRWKAQGGGWAVVLLAPPPPPYPAAPQLWAGQCGPGGCSGGRAFPPYLAPTPAPVILVGPAPGAPAAPVYQWEETKEGGWNLYRDGVWLGYQKADGWHPAVTADAYRHDPFGSPPADAPPVPAAGKPPAGGDVTNYGVDLGRVHAGRRWYLNGSEVDRGAVFRAVGPELPNDADRYHLTAVVGDFSAAATARALDQLPPEVRGKLHVQVYAPDDWAVGQFRLSPGLTLRRPAANRVGAEVGAADAATVNPADPGQVARWIDGLLNPKPPAPPAPPAPPSKPEPPPVSPAPSPPPPSDAGTVPTWVVVVGGLLLVLTLFWRKT